MLRMEEHPAVDGDTAWVSQYGLYDALSDAMKRFVDGLHTAHTSRLQCTCSSPPFSTVIANNLDDTILDSWQVGPNRPPIDTHHPAVRTHPVTGLKALNVNNGFVTSFPELKKEESDKLLEFFRFHVHSADDHYVRWKWAVGSVAMWDNVSSWVLLNRKQWLLTWRIRGVRFIVLFQGIMMLLGEGLGLLCLEKSVRDIRFLLQDLGLTICSIFRPEQ
jgi:hypothetical protein